MIHTVFRRSLLGRMVPVLLAGCLVLAACGDDDDTTSDNSTGDTAGDTAGDTGDDASGEQALVGLFRLDPGVCEGADVTGSYFRMVQSGGTLDAGPFVANGDSPCEDKSLTVLSPGTDGGLRTGDYQPQPDPAFDADGNATSGLIAQPQNWFAVAFAVSTNPEDPQTSTAAPAPSIVADGGALSGDLSAVGASWNGQLFNQGAPKPGGERPEGTTGPTGTYDEATGAFTLDWTSPVEGGPFNGFTGVWHLEGTFEAA